MLEIKDIRIRVKKEENWIVENISFTISRDGKITVHVSDSNDFLKLFSKATNKNDYVICIGEILFDGKKVVDPQLAQRLKTYMLDTFIRGGDENHFLHLIPHFPKESYFHLEKVLRNRLMNQLNSSHCDVEDTLCISRKESSFKLDCLKVVGRPLNANGFTLVELLATISILALLSAIAIPNVVSVSENNKKKTYVDNAKQMISFAEYQINSNVKYVPSPGKSICMSMGDLGNHSFDMGSGKAPYGGTYLDGRSYVKVTNNGSCGISYYVQILESKGQKIYGISLNSKSEVYSKTTNLVKNHHSCFSGCTGEKVNISYAQIGGGTNGSDRRGFYEDVIIDRDDSSESGSIGGTC